MVGDLSIRILDLVSVHVRDRVVVVRPVAAPVVTQPLTARVVAGATVVVVNIRGSAVSANFLAAPVTVPRRVVSGIGSVLDPSTIACYYFSSYAALAVHRSWMCFSAHTAPSQYAQ